MFIPDNKDGFSKSEMPISSIQDIYHMTEIGISDNEDGVFITGLGLMVVDHTESGVRKYLSELKYLLTDAVIPISDKRNKYRSHRKLIPKTRKILPQR